jgi:hypothetical protein
MSRRSMPPPPPCRPFATGPGADGEAPFDEHALHALAADALLRRVLARMRDAPEMLSTKHDAGASLTEQIRKHLRSTLALERTEAN